MMGKGRGRDFSASRAAAFVALLGACGTTRSSEGPPRVIIVAVPLPPAADRPVEPAATPTCEIVPVEPARIVGDLWLLSVRQPDPIPAEPGDTVAPRPNASLDVWDLTTGERARTFDLAAPLSSATEPAFSSTDHGRLIVAAPEVDQHVRASILDLRTPDAAEALGAEVSFPTDVAVSKDATRGAIIGKHDELAVFELPSGKLIAQRPREAIGATRSVTLSKDGSLVYTLAQGRVTMWRASDLQRIATFPSAAADDDAQIAFSPDQETIAVVEPSWAGVVSARTGARIRPFSPATLAKSAADGRIGWSADGAYVAFVDAAAGDLQIWEASTGKRLALDHGVKGTDVRIVSSPKGGHLAVHVTGGEHRIWDANRKKVRPVPNALAFAFFVDEESYIVSSTTSYELEVRRLATDEKVRTISMPEVEAIALTGSTDGRWIAYRAGPSAHVVRLADGAAVDVGAVKIAGVRHGLVRRADGAYDGPKEAEPCLVQPGVAAPRRVPGLFADLVNP